MAITYVSVSAPAQPKRKCVRAAPPIVDLTVPGRLRAKDVQALLRIGATWLDAGIKSGKYPPPDYVEGRARYWKHSTILNFLENGSAA
jgi:hypothetical protein